MSLISFDLGSVLILIVVALFLAALILFLVFRGNPSSNVKVRFELDVENGKQSKK